MLTAVELLALGAGLVAQLRRRREQPESPADVAHGRRAVGLLRTAAVGAGASVTTNLVRAVEQRLADELTARLRPRLHDRDSLAEALGHAIVLGLFVVAGGVAARAWRDGAGGHRWRGHLLGALS